MSDRKFTPPTKFPAEYVDGNGNKAVILGRGPHEVFPFIGHNADGYAASWTKKGKYYPENSTDGPSRYDLHDIPKRITAWHNVYGDKVGTQRSTRSEADDLLQYDLSHYGRLCVYRIERDPDGGNPEIFVEEV